MPLCSGKATPALGKHGPVFMHFHHVCRHSVLYFCVTALYVGKIRYPLDVAVVHPEELLFIPVGAAAEGKAGVSATRIGVFQEYFSM